MGKPAASLPEAFGRARPVITSVRPVVDCGSYPAKAAVGEPVAVEADIFADGPDDLRAEVRFRHEDETEWHTAALQPVDNDHWRGEFPVTRPGYHRFCIVATVDAFTSWRRNLVARADSGPSLSLELLVGAHRVGVTAGASAPESLVQEVVSAIEGLGGMSLREVTVATEDMHFNLPPQVRAEPAVPPHRGV